ncbi:MAG: hypothetical protein K2L88_03730 [Clostridiales bacterium]|nr:hypothetical protein [Clostridiales bacterium]
MSKKSQLKREIDDCEREIRAYEEKRERSQTALIRAMLAGTKPSKEDEQYFNIFSDLIDKEREKLRMLCAELEALKKKKK